MKAMSPEDFLHGVTTIENVPLKETLVVALRNSIQTFINNLWGEQQRAGQSFPSAQYAYPMQQGLVGESVIQAVVQLFRENGWPFTAMCGNTFVVAREKFDDNAYRDNGQSVAA